MLPEQQKHILGDFIEEAKNHLNTIEQGLLNLQNTLTNPEMVDKVFQATHSLQAGAAMLEINSIQQVAHYLEDYFNVLKECPTIQVDQKLESLFLRVFVTLQELFEQFQASFYLPEDVASKMILEVEPVLEALNQHLGLLVNATYIFDSLFNEAQDTPLSLATEEPELDDLFDTLDESEDSFDFEEDWGLGVRDWELREDWSQAPIILPATETFTSLPEPETTAATDNEEWMDLSIDLFDIGMPLDNQSEAPMDVGAMLWEETSFAYKDYATDAEEIQTTGEIGNDLEDFVELETLLLEEEPSATTTFINAEQEEDEFSLEALFNIGTPTSVQVTQAPTLLTIPDTSAGVSTQLVDDEFADLEELLEETTSANAYEEEDEFSQLDALLDIDTPTIVPATQTAALSSIPNLSSGASIEVVDDEFADLEELLEEAPSVVTTSANVYQEEDEFSQLETLLDVNMPTIVPVTQAAASTEQNLKPVDLPRRAAFERTMRVPVKHLDNVSNLVGELVVNRNSLEQDQERLRQFLGNLLHQVQQLSEVGSRMQELYERSLMEASLINMRQGSRSVSLDKSAASLKHHATGMDFDELEMDRFTGFHTLSQEMIELIVRVREASSDVEFVADETDQVARQFRQVTTQLQEGITRSRMVPFAQIAERMPRAVRDIALKYNKQAQLHIVGQETLIDKMILEQLYDPMTHLVNNSITHGIETPEERSAQGKSSVGQITIRAFYQGNQIVISVADDGAGIDAERVKAKAIQKRLISPDEANTMSHLDVYNLLFHPGFSTKDQVDEFSGRGVGMDVVRTSLNEIRGTINTNSTLGLGTTFTIRLPLTLSICKALCCLSDKAQIAFPMDGVEDMMDVSVKSVFSNEEGQSFISWRDLLLRFQPLKELLKYNRQLGRGNVYGGNREDDMISIVVLRSAGKFLAIQVDQVLGEQEIVIKQLEGPAPKPVGVAGATVLGDGRIMPIADVLELIDLSMGRLQSVGGASSLWAQNAAPVTLEKSESVKTERTVLIVDDSITVRELLSITFNKAGYRVEQARDGQEAWDKLRDGLPCDIVFCDIEMPRMDGLELLSRMQKDIHLSHMPIAMLTSRGADRHRQMAIQLGASGYFIKPYLEEALLDGAQRMLRGEVLVVSN